MTTKVFILPRLINPAYFAYSWECLNLEIRDYENEIVLVDYDETFGIPELADESADELREEWIKRVQSEFGEAIKLEKPVKQFKKQENLNIKIFLGLPPEAQRSFKSIAASQVFNCLHFAFFGNLFTELNPYYISYIDTKAMCEDMICRHKPFEIILFNGRWPDQVGINEVARKYKIPTNHIEAGFPTTSRWFYEKFQTNDLRAIDQYLKQSFENTPDLDDKESFASAWAQLQANSVTENPYLRKQQRIDTAEKKTHSSCAIFTSSIDEFYSNLPFDDCGWGTQENAIRRIVTAVESQKIDVTVRLHPNLGNKSWVDVISTYIEFKSLNCRVIYPWESHSSYNLIDSSDLVMTWGSTIGLEAAYSGKRVAFFGPTIYRSLLGAEQLTPDKLQFVQFRNIKMVDRRDAKSAIYMTRNWGRNLSQANPFKTIKTRSKDLEAQPTSFASRLNFHLREIYKIFRHGLRSSPNRTHHYLLKIFGDKLSNQVMLMLVILLSKLLRRRILIARDFL
jgi:hypothetical protein